MNRADLLFEALKDGKPRSRREIFDAVGEHFMTNNAAVELRDRGYVVEHSREGRLDVYRLLGGGDVCWRELAHSTTVPSTEQPVLHSPPPAAPIVPASEWTGNPAAAHGGGASDGAHLSDGAEAGPDSGDTSAVRVAWHAAGNGSPRPASPEQLSIDDALAAA